jgi:hypothetical protein
VAKPRHLAAMGKFKMLALVAAMRKLLHALALHLRTAKVTRLFLFDLMVFFCCFFTS